MPYFDQARGKWRGEVRIQGRRQCKLFATKREAKKWESKESEKLTRIVTHSGFLTTYTEYLEYCSKRYTTKTFEEKNALGKRFMAYLGGDRSLEAIDTHTVHEFLMDSAGNVSNNRSNKDRKNLLAFWNWSTKVLSIEENPVARLGKLPHGRAEQYIPPESDIRAVIMAADRRERAFLQCYLQTAARRREVMRWKWGEDIDFTHRLVRLGTRKTADGSMSYVWLPMTSELHDSLKWWYKNRQHRTSVYVWTIQDGPHEGERYTYRRKFLAGLCKRAGVRVFQFHAIRRYAASLLAQRGGAHGDHPGDPASPEPGHHGAICAPAERGPEGVDGVAVR